MNDTSTRRQFLTRTGSGLLAVQVGGTLQWLTPRAARAAGTAMQVLTPAERQALEALAETLLPGAAEAGIAPFIDHHLAVPAPDCLLMLRYLDVPPPFVDFYRAGLRALDAAAGQPHGKTFAELDTATRTALVQAMGQENPQGWDGPPAPFFYYVLRADAVDVVYGTEEGFKALDVPYLAHIPPPTPW
jgi:Gluconate 2-dehydrogenase subunit 3